MLYLQPFEPFSNGFFDVKWGCKVGVWNAEYRHWKRKINAKRGFGHSFSCIFWISKMNIQCNSNAILAQNQMSPFWTSNCTLMTMSRSRFEGCLNTVWTPFEVVSLLRLFSERIYTILWTGVGTCTRTHYARMRAQKKGLRCPSPDAPWAAACFPVYGAFFDVFGTFPVCRYKGWSTQVKRTSQFWASNLGRNHHKIQAKSPFWDVWFLLHIHVKISLIPLFTRLPAYILRVTQRDIWY